MTGRCGNSREGVHASYPRDGEALAEALRDGWLHTGDLAMVDEDGYVTILDRKKNIIIRGGENISGLEVEGAIHRHPAVAEAAVFPTPDDRLGEVPGAAIQLRDGAALTSGELRDFLGRHMTRTEFTFRHRWREGDLVFWDNRFTLHYPIDDFTGYRRLLHRCTALES